uniref:GAG-pre-integrase domain-containing protein n=1 Tax=Picea glauca TaxID=3330 RepID=A0A101LWL9_PICGL|nr:hypothetical protein ABT39_MTgene1402 [Picea glauca]
MLYKNSISIEPMLYKISMLELTFFHLLWHRRLGHVFSPRLRYFISTGMLGSVPNIEISTCMG